MTDMLHFIEEIRRHAGAEVIPPGAQIEARISAHGVPNLEISGAIWTLLDDTAVRMTGDLIQQYRGGQLVAERLEAIDDERNEND